MEDAPQRSDVILIPGSSKSAIVEKAAALYHSGYAPYVLPSGKYSLTFGRFASEYVDDPRYGGEYATEYEYCKAILLRNGVPESAILREDMATNSMENAMYSARVLREAKINVKRAIICCQAFHARRAFLSYACHFEGTELLVVPTDTQGITKSDWYRSDMGYQKVMGEVAKCGTYFKDMGEKLR